MQIFPAPTIGVVAAAALIVVLAAGVAVERLEQTALKSTPTAGAAVTPPTPSPGIQRARVTRQESRVLEGWKADSARRTRMLLVIGTALGLLLAVGGGFIVRAFGVRVRAEDDLKRQQLLMESVFGGIRDGVVAADLKGKFLIVNPAAQAILGVEEEPDPARWSEHYGVFKPDTVTPFPPEDLPLFRAMQGEATDDTLMHIRHSRLSRDVWLSVSCRPLRDHEGTLCGGVVILNDMTSRYAAEQNLRLSEERFRALLESAPDAIVIVNPRGRIDLANAQMESLFGYTRPELIGQTIDMLVPERFRGAHAGHRSGFTGAPKRRAMGEGRELFGLRKDGSEFPVEISLSPMEGPDGISVTAAIRDVTERKAAEHKLVQTIAELKRSNDELEQFAYVTSHDLQEPLRMVTSYTQLLATRYSDRLDGDAREFIAYAVDGSTRMRRLIQDLLAYSRAGTSEEPRGRISSEAALTVALANLEGAIQESSAIVTHDPLPTVSMRHSQLVQVFQNLIGNAIKYRSEHIPRIHITASLHPQGYVFSVQDNGIGIDPEQFQRIFIIFQRLHGRNAYSGTGIGLAICRKLVERHGGRIWVDSEPGQGSTFHFALVHGEAA